MKNLFPILSMLFLLFNCTEDTILEQENNISNETARIQSRAIMQNDWLNHVKDNTKLVDISLVGSHDAGAYKKGGALAICQQDDIATQLNAGVRYFDIRLNYESEKQDLQVYHGIVNQDLVWEKDIYQPIADFLNNNPSEFVYVTLKNESGDNEGLWRNKLLNSLSQKRDRILSKISNQTTLAEARGKIIILNRSYLENQYNPMNGIRYNAVATNALLNESPMYFADVFKVNTLLNHDIQNKFNTIEDGFFAAQDPEYAKHFIINNANGTSVWAYPNAVADRINPKIYDYLMQNEWVDNTNIQRFGYLVLDFSTSTDGRKIIDLFIAKTINAYRK